MVERGIVEGICHSIYQYAKADKKYMKDHNKDKESSYLQYWDVNNSCGWTMSLKLPVNNFEWIKNTFQSTEDFMKNRLSEKLPTKSSFKWSVLIVGKG